MSELNFLRLLLILSLQRYLAHKTANENKQTHLTMLISFSFSSYRLEKRFHFEKQFEARAEPGLPAEQLSSYQIKKMFHRISPPSCLSGTKLK